MLEAAFWLSALVVGWTYFGYPVAMAACAALRPRPVKADREKIHPTWGSEDNYREDIHPVQSVTVVLAVRNEATRLEGRIRNLLDQDVGSADYQIVIVPNGCTDDTPQKASQLAVLYDGVICVNSPASEGKAGALNRGVAAATGEIIVFADARQTFAQDTIRTLVRPFLDPNVGAVSGRLVIRSRGAPSVRGVGTYWMLETWLRDSESASGSVVGATGAIHSVRKALYRPLPPQLILDDVLIPMQVAMQGFRVVRANEATANDVSAEDTMSEFRRKVRTLTGNIQLVSFFPDLLSPRRNPLFFRFLSHKLLRLVAPVLLLCMVLVAFALEGPFYRFVMISQLTFYGLGILGLILPLGFLSIPAGFVLLNAAAIAAILKGPVDADAVWHESRTLAVWPPAESVDTDARPAHVERREAS